MARPPRIHINEDAIKRLVQPQVDRIERDSNDKLHAVLRQVRDEMEGQPADEIYPVLVERIHHELPAFQLHEDKIREIAAEIEAGTLTG